MQDYDDDMEFIADIDKRQHNSQNEALWQREEMNTRSINALQVAVTELAKKHQDTVRDIEALRHEIADMRGHCKPREQLNLKRMQF